MTNVSAIGVRMGGIARQDAKNQENNMLYGIPDSAIGGFCA